MKTLPYLLPLFWLHGEKLSVIEAELRAMADAGLRGFILESRPFPDYMGNFWWETLEFIFELADTLGMQAMIFDDSHFPSGYADGRIAAEHPEHLRLLLEPVAEEIVHRGGKWRFDPAGYLHPGDREIAEVFLYRKIDDHTFSLESLIELPRTACEIELAPGNYTVELWKITRNGGEEHTRNYINFLSREAVKCYLDTVYVPHVEKLRRFIGRSFLGFFSDEPRLGNAPSYDALPGRMPMSLPYHPSLDLHGLPHLRLDSDDRRITDRTRQRFMDQVSDLYSRAFPQQVGEFCRRNGLLYIGHVVEDNGAHAHLGYGNGHYFRSQRGQDWAGVDTVLGQNRPDRTDGILPSVFGTYDARFFHWELMLLGGSCGAIGDQPAFVENFGAYGWGEGLAEMKWHTDLALVRGVNRIVPHAFSPRFPDPDCPPHFFARGNNPQWRFFHLWREYADTACRLLSHGDWATRCGVLYHAETEWTGRSTLRCRDVIRTLALAQYSCVIVPLDALRGRRAENGVLRLGKVRIDTLVVGDPELLPEGSRADLAACGLRLIEVGRNDLAGLPARIGGDADRLELTRPAPTLRFHHLTGGSGSELYFMVNESLAETVDTGIVNLPRERQWHWFDPIRNENYRFDGRVFLAPGESMFLSDRRTETAGGALREELAESFELPVRTVSPEFGSDFCGTLQYDACLEPSDSDLIIELPEQKTDVISCFVGGSQVGTLFAPPYRFRVARELLKTPVRLRLELTNTLAARFRGGRFDRDVEPPPPGLKSGVRCSPVRGA